MSWIGVAYSLSKLKVVKETFILPVTVQLLWRSQPPLSGCPVATSQTVAHSLSHGCRSSALRPTTMTRLLQGGFFLWYPIGSYSLVSSLQLPYGLGSGEGREQCVLRNTTQRSRTASWHNAHLTRHPAAPTCRRKHCTPGDRVGVHCARPATGVASARWDKDIPASQDLP
jgi:hypothetical protein